jgi:D-alanyl-D-alanine carboxypeptidase/D-alanyl-D-alanine-endopeptidase (penicillin-binding protein 4)
MPFLTATPFQWLRQTTAIASAAIITSLSVTAASATVQETDPVTAAESVQLAASQLPNTDLCAADLDEAIAAVIRRPQFASAQWGIVVQPLGTAEVLYAHNSDTLLIPASNIKLFTTAAALRIVGERSPDALVTFKADLDVINRQSDNRLADDLLKGIGGQQAVRYALEPLGIRSDGYRQVDGSGLSRSNKANSATLVALLAAMQNTAEGALFYDSLPVGGINGTLRNRFKNTPLQGRVHAKTGTLRGVRALSGYLETDDYGTVVFSIVVNQPGQTGSVMLAAIDEMVFHISRLNPCE